MTSPDELIGVRYAARLLRVHENTVRNWAKQGILVSTADAESGYSRFSKADVLELRDRMDKGFQPRGQDNRRRIMDARAERDLYRNALAWIRHVASLHYLGGAFGPEHMRDLANMAAAALQRKAFPDYTTTMTESREKAAEFAALFASFAEGEPDDNGTSQS